MSEYFIHDARTLSKVVAGKVDLIVTSPPYFDLKDYGPSNQIGFGQAYDDYLLDMEKVLKQCFVVTKDTGSMWLVVDTLKKSGQFKLLPFDLCRVAEKTGWKLQEIIIWEKDRTLPYSRKGEMRNIFEYVLFFVKSSGFKYFPERITDFDFKEWWIKYPERYSTNGKIPTDIWKFPIPVQGSWGSSYVRHFCPLPSQLIGRIIELCSNQGDIVFDPFAGSGAVLAEAYRLKREYVGCDLNPDFKKMFEKYIKNVSQIDDLSANESKNLFSSVIMKLRMLKLPSAVLKNVKRHDPGLFEEIVGVVVEPQNKHPIGKNKYWSVRYDFIVKHCDEELLNKIRELFTKAPFSKYGIESELHFTKETRQTPRYEYEWSSTHKEPSKFTGQSKPFIASNLRLTTKERQLIKNYVLNGKIDIKPAILSV